MGRTQGLVDQLPIEQALAPTQCGGTSRSDAREVASEPNLPTGYDEGMFTTTARRMWQLLEPYHALIYFHPDARERYASIGLKGGWMGYFASRSAAMGPVPPEVVVATFYNFHPRMVRRAIPDAWQFSSPELVLRARYEAADSALRNILGDAFDGVDVEVAAGLARRAAETCDPAGRPLHAAHASLPWPDLPHMQLWHASTLLREHRGDGHVAVLVSNDIDGCEAHLTLVAAGGSTAEMQREYRGWSEEEWAGAHRRLQARGLIDDNGNFTDAGRGLRAEIEHRTDELAAAPYAALAADGCDRLERALISLTAAIGGASIPYPNPMGLPPTI